MKRDSFVWGGGLASCSCRSGFCSRSRVRPAAATARPRVRGSVPGRPAEARAAAATAATAATAAAAAAAATISAAAAAAAAAEQRQQRQQRRQRQRRRQRQQRRGRQRQQRRRRRRRERAAAAAATAGTIAHGACLDGITDYESAGPFMYTATKSRHGQHLGPEGALRLQGPCHPPVQRHRRDVLRLRGRSRPHGHARLLDHLLRGHEHRRGHRRHHRVPDGADRCTPTSPTTSSAPPGTPREARPRSRRCSSPRPSGAAR